MAEPTTEWHRSSFCSDGACLEVASVGEGIALRDGKNRDAALILFSKQEWEDFLDGVAAGDFRSL